MKQLALALFACITICSCRSSTSPDFPESLSASAFKPFGRTVTTAGEGVELISSASHIGFSFEGEEVRLITLLSDWQDHNYLQYELDGAYQGRIKINGKDTVPIVLKAVGQGKHSLWIYKATEAHTGPVFVKRIEGRNVQALEIKPAPLIEFIGNSITCGAAADPSEVPCGTGAYHDQHNSYLSYGPRVARALNTNFLMSSVSGIGIYRNWNSNGPAMPAVYEKSDFQLTGSRNWDFRQYNPAIVSIALGTNDFSMGDGKNVRLPFDSISFVSNYIRFVQLVKTKYPQAQIALLSSPMMNGDNRTLLQNCLTAVKSVIDQEHPATPVACYFFKPMQARGCTGHPNVDDHRIMAEELTPFFKELLAMNAQTKN